MARDNFADNVLEKMMQRIEGASDKLAVRYKNVKPFDTAEISTDKQLETFENLGTQDRETLLQKYGAELLLEYYLDMRRLQDAKR